MMRPVPLGLLVAVLAIGADQVTKWWILASVMDPPRIINVTPFFNVVLVWNRGISFGMFSNESMAGVWILSFLALIIVGFLFNWLRKAESKRVAISLGLIIGGALGNVIDRAVHSAVLDFLDFYIGSVRWPAFNAADSFITVGAILLILDSLFSRGSDQSKIKRHDRQ
ncbi:MAG: signal peptidase II [Rhodospirillaceae bacterium]|nr:signal peptidase II [Rhodospirillaceae bacterium]